MLDDHRGTPRLAAGATDGAVDNLEQLGYRHAGRARLVEVLVASLEGDDQVLSRGQQRVQEQLAVLAGGVAVAHLGTAQQQVVAVLARGPGEGTIVQAQ